MSSKRLCLCAAVCSLLLVLLLDRVSAAGRYDSIFSFGDSSSDTGNNLVVFPPSARVDYVLRPPYGSTFFGRPTGRCSDGRLVVDFIAQHLGLPFVPLSLAHDGSFRQGANFAVSGSTALDAAFFHHLLPRTKKPLNTSLQWFESLKPSLCSTTQECETFFSRSLFVVGAFGANDYGIFVENSAAGITLMLLVPDVIGAISMAVERLIKHGATSLVVPGVIPLGCIPKTLTGDSSLQEYNKLEMHHNLLLQVALDKLRVRHPGTTIVYADQFNPVMDMVESPAKFGFEEDNLLTPCCGGPGTLLCGDDGGNICENPSARLFWDAVHPTEATYHHIAHDLLRTMDDIVETPDTVVDPSFCGPVLESEPKCMLHSKRPKKMVAFEGTLTGRRFLGCSEQVGVNCGVVQWVDAPWPEILQRCLGKLWETFHEQSLGRVNDKEAHEREVAKRKKENDMEL